MPANTINPITGKTDEQVLAESTAAAQKAAAMIGQTFTPTAPVQSAIDRYKITSQNIAPESSAQYKTPATSPVPDVAGLSPESTPTPLTAPEEKAQGLINDIQSATTGLTGLSAFRAEQEVAQGLPELQKTQNELSSRLKALQNEALAIPLQFQQTDPQSGVAQVFREQRKTDALRANAIAALGVSSLLEASRGNLSLAQDQIDRLVSAKYEPLREAIKVKTANLELLISSPEYSRGEKLRAQKQLDIQKAKEAELDKQKTETENIYKIALEAAKNGADSMTLRNIQAAKTAQDAIDIAAKAGVLKEKNGGGGLPVDQEAVDNYAQLLAEGKITVSNVPQGIRNAVISASNGIVNTRLSDTSITKINDTEFAITSLNDLRTKLQGNLDKIGPLTGLEAINPYSEKRKLLSDIDRVRQTVGKALEGGVLRKEDEEKYKKILATITDTPETALYKIDSLISSIQGNIQNYKKLQSESGRFVPNLVDSNDPLGLR